MSKERLVELIAVARNDYYDYSDEMHESGMSVDQSSEEYIADHLIANGVIVPPCKVGDEVWVYNQLANQIYKNVVVCIKTRGTSKNKNTISLEYRNVHGETSCRKFTWSQIGKQVFLTREAAEAKLKESESE